MPSKPTTSLSIATVCFNTPVSELTVLLDSLLDALKQLREEFELYGVRLSIIDNSEADKAGTGLPGALSERLLQEKISIDLLSGHGNIGYGSAHNLVIGNLDSEFHLMLNPDVALDPAALREGVRYLIRHPETVLVSPRAVDEQGVPQHLCKRYPALFTLVARGFSPALLRRLFDRRLARYEMRQLQERDEPRAVDIASGCFMLCRTGQLQAVGGFDPRYFLYFEDFDLSLRLVEKGSLVYLPAMKIVHRGGNAARKGLHHIRLFSRSAMTFYHSHGWCLFSQP